MEFVIDVMVVVVMLNYVMDVLKNVIVVMVLEDEVNKFLDVIIQELIDASLGELEAERLKYMKD